MSELMLVDSIRLRQFFIDIFYVSIIKIILEFFNYLLLSLRNVCNFVFRDHNKINYIEKPIIEEQYLSKILNRC